MLAWMFNRQKGKDAAKSSGDKADSPEMRLRRMAEIARSVAPEAMAEDPASIRTQLGRRRNAPSRDTWDSIDAEALFGKEAAADFYEDPDDIEDEDAFDDPFAGEARQDLGRRLRRHMPDISPSRRLAMVDELVEAMDRMASTYLPLVKSIVERELGCSQYLTRQAAQRLIYDVHTISGVSVLDYTELLNDADMLDILRGRGMFVRVAEGGPAPDLNDPDHIDRRDPDNGNIVPLKERRGRKLQDNSPEAELQRRLGGRERLSLKARRRIAHFVAASIFDTLVENRRIRAEVARAVRQAVRQRIERSRFENVMVDTVPEPPMANVVDLPTASAEAAEGASFEELTPDQAILEALTRGEDIMVLQALCHHAQLPEGVISKILESGSARAVVALAWLAGMEASHAVVLQMSVGIPEDSLIQPGPGGRYAVPASELKWYIDFFSSMAPTTRREEEDGPTLFEP